MYITTRSQVTGKRWTTVHDYVTTTITIIDLCGCHRRYGRARWWPPSLRYVETTTPCAELQDCQDQHCHSYVNITTTSQSYVSTITSSIKKWSDYFNQSGKVVSITLICVKTITTTTPVMETSMPTTADVWIWHDHCRSASYYAHHHRATEDRFITLKNYMIPPTPPSENVNSVTTLSVMGISLPHSAMLMPTRPSL